MSKTKKVHKGPIKLEIKGTHSQNRTKNQFSWTLNHVIIVRANQIDNIVQLVLKTTRSCKEEVTGKEHKLMPIENILLIFSNVLSILKFW